MKHAEFKIGMQFTFGHGGKVWEVTDIGQRTVIAIKEKEGWMAGPPYAVDEVVFDEHDIPACEPLVQS